MYKSVVYRRAKSDTSETAKIMNGDITYVIPCDGNVQPK